MKLFKSPELLSNIKKSPDQKLNPENKNVTKINGFSDVAGLDEVKEELMEVSDFLLNPNKYLKYGAKIPRGIMFYGPPGTGKTLLARALAYETNAGFIYASGSEFIEKFVGIGASRIRNLFEKASKKSPCIIFIDEIDAIGVSRNTDNNSERDQTLNQFLIELDGFKQSQGVVVIAATNRLDMLDKALLRPGRFDRQIYIGNPSKIARQSIILSHLDGKPVSKDIEIEKICLQTSGLSGAHIANIVNEATLLTIRQNKKCITNEIMDQAIIKTTAGLKNKTIVLTKKEKKSVSYHEAGHALVGFNLTKIVPDKISIIPHGQALGFVLTSQSSDKYLLTKKELEDKIAILLAGRASEEIILGEVSTGAANDLEKANELARAMVCEYGMSDFKNKTFSVNSDVFLAKEINEQINIILQKAYDIAKNIIVENTETLCDIADALYKNEDLSKEKVISLLNAPIAQ